MLKHAQRKNNARTKRRRPGVSVNNRFRIDVYLETREQVERVDKAAKLSQTKSRSAFASAAVVAAADKVLLEEAK